MIIEYYNVVMPIFNLPMRYDSVIKGWIGA